eukprot:TRINITY_DN3635_c0_g1_i3.p2 TRINITY_DN3635_c0_g1~~TRINITY_DN3635_c0_g1_i3.p2  ORF type:complete len:168 (-),score=23.25 TRINITY_DN3635_c0_g1_i3:130-633(-)
MRFRVSCNVTSLISAAHGPPPSPTQIGLLRMLAFFESCLLGFSFAILVKIIPVLKKISDTTVRRKSILVIASVWWMMANWWPHVRLHGIVDPTGMQIPRNLIIIDACFHWTVMIASGIMAFSLYSLIQLGVNYSKSPFREITSSGSSDRSTEVKIEMSNTSSNTGDV